MILIPPSINWFNNNSIDAKPQDGLLVAACFKTVAVFKFTDDLDESPTVTKLISYQFKIIGISLYPFEHSEYGRTACILGENSRLSLFNIDSKAFLYEHVVQKTNLQAMCWATLDGEEVVAAVGENGSFVIWQPKSLVAYALEIPEKKTFTLISILPHCRHEALVASKESLLHIRLKDGSIVNRFKGHDKEIYSLKWCPLDANPLSTGGLVLNTRWKNDDKEPQKDDAGGDKGPFFVTTDLKRNVFVWDFSLGRYVIKTLAAGSGYNPKYTKDKNKPQHIAVAWTKNRLFSSTPFGEIVTYDLGSKEAKAKVLGHPHANVIYNMVAFGDLLVTVSFDRTIRGFNITSNKEIFNIPTMGYCANAMAFSPHDANRLALGQQDGSITILTFGSKSLNSRRFSKGFKGKVITLSWHPENEIRLLFGTSDGQVGHIDLSTGNVTSFSHFHRNPTYKVEWGPPFASEGDDEIKSLCPYSFGDHQLLLRNPSNEIADPIKVHPYLLDENKSLASVTEFSFSYELKYLAVGYHDGSIKIFDVKTAALMLTISNIRKSIQHILWKPPIAKDSPYIIAVGSGESYVYVYDLDQQLRAGIFPITIWQPTKQLIGHLQRIVWLSWSPHNPSLLASASYDSTVQIWDADKGEPIVNYDGHYNRVFRVEFSPNDPDVVISFAEESCIHSWKMSQLTCRTPTESAAIAKSAKLKNRTYGEANLDSGKTISSKKKEERICRDQSPSKKSDGADSLAETTEISSRSTARNAKRVQASQKALFTDFHLLNSRKRPFHHIAIMTLLQEKTNEASKHSMSNGVESLPPGHDDDDLDEDPMPKEPLPSSEENPSVEGQTTTVEVIEECLEKYDKLLQVDVPKPSPEDVGSYLDFFTDTNGMNRVLSREIEAHEKKQNFLNANMIHCMRGSLSERIKWAAIHKKLDTFLVSMAPQVSFSLWEFACEAYANQLIESGDIVLASNYLISIRKIEEAIDLLLRHKYFKEAYAIAKCRMPFQSEILKKVITIWGKQCLSEGNMEIVVLLNLSIGDIENAARCMSRRNEPGALTVSAFLYNGAKCPDLTLATSILSLSACSIRYEFDKIELLLENLPEIKWFTGIYLCLKTILGLKNLEKSNSLVEAKNILEISREQDASYSVGDHPLSWLPSNHPFLYIIQLWQKNQTLLAHYQDICSQIQQMFSDRNPPTTAKQLWFQASITLCEMIMEMSIAEVAQEPLEAASQPIWEKHLNRFLSSFIGWAKYDQAYYLTHFLLPAGTQGVNVFEKSTNSVESLSLNIFKIIYILSEFGFLLEQLQSTTSWLPWKLQSESLEQNQVNSDLKNLISLELTKEKASHLQPEKQQESSSPELSIQDLSSTINGIQNLSQTSNSSDVNTTEPSFDDQNNDCELSGVTEDLKNLKVSISQNVDSGTNTQIQRKANLISRIQPSPNLVNSQEIIPANSSALYPCIKFLLYETQPQFFETFKNSLRHLIELLSEEMSSKNRKSREFNSDPKGLVQKIVDALDKRNLVEESTLPHLYSLIQSFDDIVVPP